MNRLIPRAPVVLAHGLFGFEKIALGRWTLATYFRGIPDFLRSLGVRVYVPRVHPTAGIARRAEKLGDRIRTRFPGQRVHIIGHSFGGLDARQLLMEPEWQDRVLSLTTIATPHLGSSFALSARRKLGPIYHLLRAVGWDHQGFFDLMPDAARRWHESTPCPEHVAAYSIAGAPEPRDVCWPLRKLHSELLKCEGPNDGLVSVESTRAFGTVLPACPVDHLRQMNWCTGLPSRELAPSVSRLYESIMHTLARVEAGFPQPEFASEPVFG